MVVHHADVNRDACRLDSWGRYMIGAPNRDAGRHALPDCKAGRCLEFAWRRGRHDTVVRIELHPRGERCIVALENLRRRPGRTSD